MKCPACNYLRKESDDAPDWQCPSCKIAYCKYSAENPASIKKSDLQTLKPKENYTPKRSLFKTIVVIGTIAILAYPIKIFFYPKELSLNSKNINTIVTIENTQINLSYLSTNITNGAQLSLDCLNSCQTNKKPNDACMAVSAILYNNKDNISILRSFYNAHKLHQLNFEQKKLFEKIRSNIIDINKNMATAVSFCNKENTTPIERNHLNFNVPKINIPIKGKFLSRDTWLKQFQSISGIAMCNNAMENQSIKDKLEKQNINLDKCIEETIPSIFNICKNQYYDALPLEINDKNIKVLTDQMLLCLTMVFAKQYIFKKE